MGNTTSADLAATVAQMRVQPLPEVEPYVASRADGAERRDVVPNAAASPAVVDAAAFEAALTVLCPAAAVARMDVCASVPPNTIREMRVMQPRNLVRLIVKARLLSRILPIVFEDPEYDDAFVQHVFWQDEIPLYVQPEGDAAQASSEEERVPVCVWVKRSDAVADYPLGRALVHIAVSLLYVPGFTVAKEQFDLFVERISASRDAAARLDADIAARVDAAVQAAAAQGRAVSTDELIAQERRNAVASFPPETFATEANAVWPMLLWRSGVSFHSLPVALPSAADMQNRASILRLCTALASQSLYDPPTPSGEVRSRFLDEFTTGQCPFAPTLFYSLLNTVISYDPVGWGVPYASAVSSNDDQHLVEVSLQLLMLLLDYVITVPRPTDSAAQPLTNAAAYAQFNIFRSLLIGVNETIDFEMVFNGISRLLKDVINADATVLPYSHAAFPAHQEALVLLWRFMEENPAFLKYTLERCDVTSVAGPILYLLWLGRNDPTKVSLVHLCTFLLLLMSGERAFGVALTRSVKGRLPLADLPPFEGSYADLAIITLHKLVVDGLPELAPLYSCFMTIVSNMSPYLKRISVLASVKLVNLFELFSSPRFLLARPNNYLFVAQLIETFNNIIQYQYESNPVFIYAILQRKDTFQRLATLSVSHYLAQQRLRELKAAGQLPDADKGSSDAVATGDAAEHAAGVNLAEDANANAPNADQSINDSEWVRRNAANPHAQVQPPPAPAGTPEAAAVAADGRPSETSTTGEPSATVDSTAHTAATVEQIAAPIPDAAAEPVSASEQHASAPGGSVDNAAPSDAPATNHASPPTPEWEPTDEWFEGIRSRLHLETPLALRAFLAPEVEAFVAGSNGSADDEATVEFIRSTTAVGALPRPHAIMMRRYEPNAFTRLWFKIFVYSLLYLRVSAEMPMFDSQAIRLFHIAVVTESGQRLQ